MQFHSRRTLLAARCYQLLAICSLCFSPPVGCWAATLPGAQAVIEAVDYPSLQAAIDGVPPSGGVVRLPPGEFVIDQPLIIHQTDFHLEGAGTATHIRNDNRDGRPAIILRSLAKDRGNPRQWEACWRITLSNFRLTGNERSGHGIEAYRINELFIQGVTISQHGGDGISTHFCYEDMRLSDALITYNRGAGLRAQGNHDTIVSATQFEENLHGVCFIDGFNLTLSGNNIDDHLGHGVVIENSMGSLVTANMIEQCAGGGVVLARDVFGTTLSGNILAQNFGGGIDLRDAHGVAVAGNSFVRCKQFGVRVASASGRVAIQGNAFCDSFAGEGPRQTGPRGKNPNVNEAAGVLLEATQQVTLSGNSMSGLVTRAWTQVGACQDIVEQGNQAIECADQQARVEHSLGIEAPRPLDEVRQRLRVVATIRDEHQLAGAHDVCIHGTEAYVAGKDGCLAELGLPEPGSPSLRWSMQDKRLLEDAQVVHRLDSERLLVGGRSLHLFGIGNGAPRLLTTLQQPPPLDRLNGLTRRGDVVIGACKNGQLVAVEVIGDSLRWLGSRSLREQDQLNSPHDAVFCGDYLVVASPEGFGRETSAARGKLGVFRVVDPVTQNLLPIASWERVARFEHPRLAGANRLCARGSMVYVASSLADNGERVDDLRSNVAVIDLSEPGEPFLRGSLDFPDQHGPNGLEIVGEVLFAAGGQTVQAIDVSNANQPWEWGRVTDLQAFPAGADDGHELVYHQGRLLVTAQRSQAVVMIELDEESRLVVER
jgi:hypothetical protein